MCEWLSSGEWSDVWLLCGGRSFAAHRAVLASVSTFLHRILLSCPIEDSPTFIVLPDFDLDAMSSVLYYIYNGEVVIQKHKLEMFMEIVRAMQIFIDAQYLPSGCREVQKLPLMPEQKSFEDKKVYCLGEGAVENYINLKKSNSHDNFLLNKSSEDSVLGDKQKCTDSRIMESACGDRQRSFLRDLFIETYPRNGNVNGRAAGVLAIQSTRYRAPASELLTNANGEHLRDTREIHTKSTDVPQYSTSSTHLSQITNINDHSNLIYSAELAQLRKFNSAFSYFNPTPLLENSKNELKGHLIDHFTMYTPKIDIQEFTTGNSSVDLRSAKPYPNDNFVSTRLLIDDNNSQERKMNVTNSQSNLNIKKLNSESFNNTRSLCPKSAVLNEVLDSPWRPRQPTNYRPFRRKTQDTSRILENSSKKYTLNDSNNNIRASPSPEVLERLSADASTLEQPFPVARLAVAVSDFKCAVCDQVFTNEEALSAHARRHSVPARYSCTQCSKSFSQLRNFKYHMSVHRGTREFAATCSVCGKYFNDRGYLSSHMKIHRNRKEYKCSQCPKSFNQRVAYNMHVRIHTGVKPHVCNECGKAFSRKMLLKQHQRTHSGERPYACTHCDKRFADRSNMTLHLRLHTGVKPFSCTLCPKSFTKKHHLKSHLNFHTGAKPYSCPKCKLAFTQSSNMRTHLKKCTAPDPAENADTQGSH